MSKYVNLWSYVKECTEPSLTLTYDEIAVIAGVPLDHSFLKYKKELMEYDWIVSSISMKEHTVSFIRMHEDKR